MPLETSAPAPVPVPVPAPYVAPVPALGRREIEVVLSFLAGGSTVPVAVRKAGIRGGIGRWKKAVELSPDLAAEVGLAKAVAVGKVEEAVYREALGVRTEAEEQYVREMEAWLAEVRPDTPPEPVKPKPVSLKAAEMYLGANGGDRWKRGGGGGSGGGEGVGVAVQVNLMEAGGVEALEARLRERRDAAETVDAEVVE